MKKKYKRDRAEENTLTKRVLDRSGHKDTIFKADF